ncbi:uncharacterized protein [Anoplolepis gracilipes]|uniref:uncharacterized protein n=1 Tax=Anoplolepis gracilipes TaxID=354296 RepID=UPI003BA220B7
MKVQELENEGYKNDKKAPKANCMCTLRTCGEEKINRETCANVSARKELLVHNERINSTKLSEIINKEINNSIKKINNSIKDAVQAIVKQCSMVPRMQEEIKPILPRLKESEQKFRACQSHIMEKYHNELPNICSNRQTTRHTSRQYNYLPMCDNSYPYIKTHEDTILLPTKNKVNNEKKNKTSANNVNTDNRRMTGNVNIYICSEAKNSSQEKNKKKSKLRLSMGTTTTSSDTTTEQLNSRCASISSCKLINSIREKRMKLQAQQPSNYIPKKRSSDNIICDNKICRTKESSESSKEQTNVSDNDIECKNTTSSTGNDYCCKDTSFNSMDVEQDLSNSVVPCSEFDVCDNFRCLPSWTTIYPSEARATLNDTDASLSNTICTNGGQRNYCKSDAQNNVRENNSGYAVCHAVDGSRWLPKSIYTDCATYDKVSKERFADGNTYQNKKLQDSALNSNNISKRQVEYKHLQQAFESCQKERSVRQQSACSCITEEEEDFTNVNKVEGKFPENVYNNMKCLEKISVCQTPSNKLAETVTVCELSFNTTGERVEQTQTCESMFEDSVECLKDKCKNNVKMSVCQISCSKLNKDTTICETIPFSVARDRFEKMQTCKSTLENSVKYLKGAAVYETTFGNSEQLPKVTRVCKEFVTEESREDITVCKRMFGEPKGSPEEVIVCEALPDAEETPKETICKKISDLNFVNQDNDKELFLNDAKDNLVKENTSSSNLNIQKKNRGNAKSTLQLDNNIALNFMRQKSANDVKQNEQIKETVANNLWKVSTTSAEPIKDSFSTPLLKITYSATLPQHYDRPNRVSNLNEKEASKTFINKRKTTRMQLSLNQPIRNHIQQVDEDSTAGNSALNKIEQSEEKTREELKEEGDIHDISKERKTTEEKPRDSYLNRSVRKLIDVIKLGRMKIKERTETGKVDSEKIIADDIKDVKKFDTVYKNKEKINDATESQKINDKMTMPVKYPFTNKEMTRKAENVARPKPTAPVADFTAPEEIKKLAISSTSQTTPKLLRIIAAKRLHLPLTVTTVEPKTQELEEEFTPVDDIKTKDVDQEEIPEEKMIPQEPSPVEIETEIKAKELIAPEVTVAEVETSVKDIPKDVVDILKDVTDENKILKDETSKMYVPCPHKKLEEQPEEKSISCKCILPEPKDPSCFAKYTTTDVLCPQKKPEEKLPKSISCRRELSSDINKCPCLNGKYAKYNSIIEDSLYKNSEFEQRKNDCTYCRLSTQYPKSCLKTDKPRFRSMSPLNISPHYCVNCCRMREECTNCCRIKEVCRRAAVHCQLYKECKCCTISNNCSRIIDKCRCKSPVNCINCYRSRDRCCCVTFAPVDCYTIETNCNCKKAMICMYCDNRQDKCTCRAPIEKCSCCKLPLDVCDCQNTKGHNSNRERIIRKPDEDRSIRVTSWNPNREIRRYFARNLEDFRLDSIEECYCYKKPKQQRYEELPYQRLNIFSDVMNELQQKMSESVCCSRCWRNPCCCGSQIKQEKENRKANVRYRKAEKSLKSKSPNNCRLSSRNEQKNIVKKSILVRHIGCVCKLSPCRCRKNRLYKRPLAKCYYCKSLPCTCIIAGSPVTEAVEVQ